MKNLKELEMLKTTINLEDIFYEKKEMLEILIEIYLNRMKNNKELF